LDVVIEDSGEIPIEMGYDYDDSDLDPIPIPHKHMPHQPMILYPADEEEHTTSPLLEGDVSVDSLVNWYLVGALVFLLLIIAAPIRKYKQGILEIIGFDANVKSEKKDSAFATV